MTECGAVCNLLMALSGHRFLLHLGIFFTAALVPYLLRRLEVDPVGHHAPHRISLVNSEPSIIDSAPRS